MNSFIARIKYIVVPFFLMFLIMETQSKAFAEGTKQLEPPGSPALSYCRLSLTQNSTDNRIPFALLDCAEEFRLNIRIADYTQEKIYLGFGDVTDYYNESTVYTDVKYQLKDPTGTVVAGFSLRSLPDNNMEPGYIETREQAYLGPDINATNPDGYNPLVVTPARNGDYILEFQIPQLGQTEARVFKYFDVTVAMGNSPRDGRLWSKAWQLSSASVNTEDHGSYSLFYMYSNDSIVTRFDCNGLAGGIWAVYSNEWGCSTTGNWSERRRSIEGNATVRPQYKIFLNDPDPTVFHNGKIGEMVGFHVLPHECDTVITFTTEVSKGGNIEILLDVPPLNPSSVGPEDVQLGYSVNAGFNLLLPGWNGRNAFGIPIANGTQVVARIRFLNGLTNIPLFDVEDNPEGFRIDIVRPMPSNGEMKLKLFWDDTMLPPENMPTANINQGCVYTGTYPLSGCHDWIIDNGLGDYNTINSWWYYSSGDTLIIPITLKLSPSSGTITGPPSICLGQSVTFRTSSIPFAQRYSWDLTGQGISLNSIKNAPDTTFTHSFGASMPEGYYTISVSGLNDQCGNGDTNRISAFLFHHLPPPVSGEPDVCVESVQQYQLPGAYSAIEWQVENGSIVGSPYANPVYIRWNGPGLDTVRVVATSADCGTRLSILPVKVLPLPTAGFTTSNYGTTCPANALQFADHSLSPLSSIVSRYWEWGDGHFLTTSDSLLDHSYSHEGSYTVKLLVTTEHGCESSSYSFVQVIPHPVASFSCFRNCVSDTVQFTDLSNGIELNRWNWDFGNAPVTALKLDQRKPEAIFYMTGVFEVRMVVENRFGCRDTTLQQVIVHPNPVAAFNNDLPCHGVKVKFTDESLEADTSFMKYSWNVMTPSRSMKEYSGNPAFIVFDQPGLHAVSHTVTDLFGCSSTNQQSVQVNTTPEASFVITENFNNAPDLISFRNLSTGGSYYHWDFGNNSGSDLFEPEIRYNQEGNYLISLVASSLEGCVDTVCSYYYYTPGLWLPNAFTPNQDGHNDFFRPITQRVSLNPYLLMVYNNWGQVIFRSSDPAAGWDGTFQGKPCQMGEYLYIIQYKESANELSKVVTKKGYVNLIR